MENKKRMERERKDEKKQIFRRNKVSSSLIKRIEKRKKDIKYMLIIIKQNVE